MPELADLALPYVLSIGLAATRWVPTLMLIPVFASLSLSATTRGALALALALPIAPALFAALQAGPPPPAVLFWLALKEFSLGLLLAAVLAIPLWAVEAAGAYVDYQRGANPQALDPSASPDASLFGLLLQRSSCVYLMHAGAFHALVGALYASFAVWPPLQPVPSFDAQWWEAIKTLLSALLRFALTLALPYLLALGLVEACFALLSRANPRFPAYVAALPFKSIVALLLVVLTLPASLEAVHDIVVEHLDSATQAVRSAPPGGSATFQNRPPGRGLGSTP
jgi:type III secretion protein T